MTDFLLLERLHRMVKDIPKPRLMFRKGVAATGFFRPYMSFADYTEACIFGSFDEITPVTVRFAPMLGDRGTADTVRNIKSMNVKFRHDEGEYDMLCSSLPVFFIDEEDKFFDMAAALTKRECFDGIDTERFWRFVTENPEAVNCALRLFSYQGLSSSYIDMRWFSADPVIWKNSRGETFLVRYEWRPVLKESDRDKEKALDRLSAEFLAGFDGDRASEELESVIGGGCFPQYELYVQLAQRDEATEEEYTSRTLMWDEESVPPVAAGIMKLTGIPEDRAGRPDTLNFAPGNTVKGIELYHDEFSGMMNYLYRIEAAERGE